MKMGSIEKSFINEARHGRRIAVSAERRLAVLPYRARLTYLDVGCGSGMAAVHLATSCGFDVTGVDVAAQSRSGWHKAQPDT
jgi:2-polyprenyl-3-methyl-5-hydroxy-6-metoxy-1,4-benzoquinol methylase